MELDSEKMDVIEMKEEIGLNPCFNGTGFRVELILGWQRKVLVLILVLMELDSESYLRKKPITAGFIAISHFTFPYTKYPKFAYIVRK